MFSTLDAYRRRLMNSHLKKKLTFLLKPKAILFGFALFYYLSDYVFWHRLISSCSSQTLPCYPPEEMPAVGTPFILLVASIALLTSRAWSYPIAMWLAGKIIYEYGYMNLVTCTFIFN